VWVPPGLGGAYSLPVRSEWNDLGRPDREVAYLRHFTKLRDSSRSPIGSIFAGEQIYRVGRRFLVARQLRTGQAIELGFVIRGAGLSRLGVRVTARGRPRRRSAGQADAALPRPSGDLVGDQILDSDDSYCRCVVVSGTVDLDGNHIDFKR
jgi:hypothetical protein